MFSQIPEGISFQGVARDGNGNIKFNEQIDVKITIQLINTSQVEFTETFSPITNNYGVFSIVIGSGTLSAESKPFSELDFAHKHYDVKLWVREGTNYQQIGTATPFQSVPYALVAKTATDNFDKDSTNELQELIFDDVTNSLTITKNGNATSIDLSKFISTSNDSDSTNEIQKVAFDNSSLSLTKSNSVSLRDLKLNSLYVSPTNSNNSYIWGTVNDTSYYFKAGDSVKFTAFQNIGNSSFISVHGVDDGFGNSSFIDLYNGNKRIWRSAIRTDNSFEIAEADTTNWSSYTTRLRFNSSGTAEMNSDLQVSGRVSAKQVVDKNGVIAGVPTGVIMPFAGISDNIPEGWLLCDGSLKKIEEYKRLYEIIGNAWGTSTDATLFKLPDLRGQFLRGTDLNSGIDQESTTRQGGGTDGVGSYQKDAFGKHNHGGGIHNHTASATSAGNHSHTGSIDNTGNHQHSINNIESVLLNLTNLEPVKGTTNYGLIVLDEKIIIDDDFIIRDALTKVNTSYNGNHSNTVTIDSDGMHTHAITVENSAQDIIQKNGGSETRPVNAAVNYIIKY